LEGRHLSVTISPVKNTAKKSEKTDKSADKADKSESSREENPADEE
ncbi:MAG: hypothetical protein GX827_08700, partial [Clostridiales bacterium]|nr:hypothetical protein [Clostridiales bacterium]